MDLKAVGQRIKAAREAKNLTQEELAALVNLSTTHVSVIERGLKVTKLDTFVAIANALDVSADALLIDVVTHSVTGVTNELSDIIAEQYNTTPEEVRREMQIAIDAGFDDPDPTVQAEWKKVNLKGDRPTPEEVINYAVKQLKGN